MKSIENNIKDNESTTHTSRDKEKEITTVAEMLWNNIEASYAEDIDPQVVRKLKKIYVIEDFKRRKDKKIIHLPINEETIKDTKKAVDLWRKKASNAEIRLLFQFPKDTERTQKEISVLQDAQKLSDIALYYEHSRQAISSDFETSTDNYDFLKKNKGVILEIETLHLEKKVSYALTKGIKNFILIGGKWNEPQIWKPLIDRIHFNGGAVTILLLRRMDKDKESFIKKAMLFGADEVVHGKLWGYNDEENPKEQVNVYLDKDLFYKEEIELLDLEVKAEIAKYSGIKKYGAGRVSVIKTANTYAQAHPIKRIIKAE